MQEQLTSFNSMFKAQNAERGPLRLARKMTSNTDFLVLTVDPRKQVDLAALVIKLVNRQPSISEAWQSAGAH